MVTITIKYNVILLGGSRVGKKSFIQAAEQMFQKEALLSSYLNMDGESEYPNNETNSNNIRNRRMSISESIQSLGMTLRNSPMMSILGGSNGNNNSNTNGGGGGGIGAVGAVATGAGNNNRQNNNSGNNRGNNTNSECMNNMTVEDLRKQISEYDSFQERDWSQQVANLSPTPPNTIVVLKDYVRYELHVTSFYDTGFTDEEQEEVAKADGYFIMVDLTNRFSIQRAKMFHKKLQQICDPHYSSKAESNAKDLLGHTGTNGSGDSSESSPPAIKLPLILLGSKSDEQLGKKRQISTIEGLRLSDAWKCPFMECSAMQAHNKGIDSAIREMINIISQKKKRASIALNNAHSPSKNKRFSWRKSLSLVVGGHQYHNDRLNEDLIADVASIKTPSPSNPCTNNHSSNSTPTNSSTNTSNSSSNTNAKLYLETPTNHSNRQDARTPNRDSRRHSIAIAKNLKGLMKFGRNRLKSNPIPQRDLSTTSSNADRKSKHLSAPPRSASEEAIEAETIVKNKKKWFNRK